MLLSGSGFVASHFSCLSLQTRNTRRNLVSHWKEFYYGPGFNYFKARSNGLQGFLTIFNVYFYLLKNIQTQNTQEFVDISSVTIRIIWKRKRCIRSYKKSDGKNGKGVVFSVVFVWW